MLAVAWQADAKQDYVGELERTKELEEELERTKSLISVQEMAVGKGGGQLVSMGKARQRSARAGPPAPRRRHARTAVCSSASRLPNAPCRGH